jgi:hypothetical protein
MKDRIGCNFKDREGMQSTLQHLLCSDCQGKGGGPIMLKYNSHVQFATHRK